MEEMNDDMDYHSWYAQKKATYTREIMCHCRDFKVKKEVTFVKNLKLQYFKVCILLIMNLKVGV